MAYEIPNGAVAVCTVDITVTSAPFWSTPDSVLGAIGQELVFDGLTIAQKSVGLSAVFFGLDGEFKATLQIANQSGQELDDSDLAGQFADACTTVGGININSFAVTTIVGAPTGTNSGTGTQGNVQVTAAGAAQASVGTGATPAPPSTTHQCGDPTWSGFQDPVQWLKCLTQGGLTSLGLITIGLIIGVVLIVYSSGGAVHPRRASA